MTAVRAETKCWKKRSDNLFSHLKSHGNGHRKMVSRVSDPSENMTGLSLNHPCGQIHTSLITQPRGSK